MLLTRPATDADSEAVAALIRAIFAEFPGVVFDLEELPELRAIRSAFQEKRGDFWVAHDAGEIVGCVGLSPHEQNVFELHKLYVRRDRRRSGLGSQLCDLVEAAARSLGGVRMELWTDAKFTVAHRFYERRGYTADGKSRALRDRSNTLEYHYEKTLR